MHQVRIVAINSRSSGAGRACLLPILVAVGAPLVLHVAGQTQVALIESRRENDCGKETDGHGDERETDLAVVQADG